MIIFLYGADGYRSKQKLKEIIKGYKEKHKSGLNLIFCDAQKAAFPDFYDNLRSSSMFAEKKLIVFTNLFSNNEFQKPFLEKINDLQKTKDVIVIHESQEIDRRLKLFKTLVQECKSQNFELLNGSKLKNWAAKEFEKRQAKINVDALNQLVGSVGGDLWRLNGEIEKLASYKNGGTVKKEDVGLLVKPKIESDIFKTIDALALKDKKRAVNLIQKHLLAGDHPLYLLSMMAWGFKNLLIVKELAEKRMMYDSIVKKSGLHPFVVKKSYFMARQFSMEELKNIYRMIFQLDLNVKTGKIDDEAALNLLVSKI